MKRILLLSAVLAGTALFAAEPSQNNLRTVSLKPEKTGITISPTLSGIFFEDLNQSLDGGICAQLIQNFSFQAYNVPDASEKESSYADTCIFGWTAVAKNGASGSVKVVSDHPLVEELPRRYDFDPNDQYDDEQRYAQYCVRFDVAEPGDGFGIAANGYGTAPYGQERQGFYYSNNTQIPSIPVKAGVSYDLSLYLQGEGYEGGVKVYLEDAGGRCNSNVVEIEKLNDSWQKFSSSLVAERSVDSRMVVVGDSKGTFFLDFATLLPEDSELWMNGQAGPFRKDMMEALAALHPTFMRFPGGCASEGPNYFGQPFWKNSIGPREERIGFRNHWGYWTSQYVGFYEYLLMAESLGASPLPVLNNGVTCQFAGHKYIAPLETEEDRARFQSIFVDDALDFIEFCNGGVDTEWGGVRARMGHPEPFNLKYLGIGNENRGPEFWERFDIIYNAVKSRYPDIIIISTAGAFAQGREFNDNMAHIDAKYQDTYVDEHYYRDNKWFYTNGDRYSPGKVRGAEGHTYDRSVPTRVFVGEFANSRANNDYASAMAEAAYWTSLERNSDMVVMAAYAPLFCKKGFGKWDSNLIWFDNRGLWRSCNYYYLQLFSVAGDKAFDISPVMNGKSVDETVYTSPTIDTGTGELFVKVVNSEALDKLLELKLGNKTVYNASVEYMSSHDTSVKNQGDRNYYSGNPEVGEVSYDEAVKPQSVQLGQVRKKFTMTLPENSIGIIRLVPVTED